METKDLALAAFLKMKGFLLLDTKVDESSFPPEVIFVFKEVDGIRQAALNFVNSEFAIFEATLRSLKKLVRAHERNKKTPFQIKNEPNTK